ncbi:MAG: shikimate kinase [Actinomycetota bacterium]|nr:shikimate kinase [Actinomycetota bacterium]MDA2970841.1 shikimate kinase [Actinomycetota bacterium]MDA3000173.1 shikimate kinase [Actinomycetota bacterium]
MSPRHVVLVGLMGSGKSSVGRHLAEAIGRPFVDTDSEIERKARRSIAELFRTSGEESFRSLEEDVLEEVLASRSESVVATGGGSVLRSTTRQRLADHVVVWLRADVDTLVDRVERGRHERPLLGDDPRGRLEELDRQRSPLYDEVANIVVDVDHRAITAVVDSIVEAIHAMTRNRQ